MSRIEAPSHVEKTPGAFSRLYRGQTRFDFVGRRRWWYALSTIIIVIGIVAISIRGLNLGIDFKGGASWEVQGQNLTVQQVTTAVEAAGLSQPVVTILGGKTVHVQADINVLTPAEQTAVSKKVVASLAALAHTNQNNVSQSTVGPTWGGDVTNRAVWALAIFFVLVVIYISFRFEPKMALAAFAAMIHDILVTVGVYAIFGFQVTPDTVVAVLTILGYSLYDTVVVFDRVRDNVKNIGGGRLGYSEIINLSMNQTMARSINTSLVAILPVLAVLVVGAEILGATTLLNYGVALFVGLLSGAYSSIFIAATILAIMKEREQKWRAVRQRLDSRGARSEAMTPFEAAQVSSSSSGGSSSTVSGLIVPGSAAARAQAGLPPSGVPRPRKAKRRKG